MAENLQLLKRRINTAKNISQISRAMEMISAAKIKKAQTAVENHRPYSQKVTELTGRLMRQVNPETFSHPYLQAPLTSKKLLIAFAPDKGLCGSLITNMYKSVVNINLKEYEVVTVGKRMELIGSRLQADVVASFSFGTNLPDHNKVYELTQLINDLYQNKQISGVDLAFTQFESLFSQKAVIKKLLPLQYIPETEEKTLDYTFEPNAPLLFSQILPLYVEVMLYNAIIQSYTSEQAARMIAMQNAKNNAIDIADYLTLSYNKLRQERITNEILDLANNQ
jgi:F-type H+-transporting ATPase subunit gamma